MLKKFFRVFLVIALSFTALLPLSVLAVDYVLLDHNTTVSDVGGYSAQTIWYDGANSRMSGQTFTAEQSAYVTSFYLYVKKVGSPTGTYKIGIKNTVAGVPDGDFLIYKELTSSDYAAWTSSYGWAILSTGLSPSQYYINSGTTYAFVCEPTSSGTNSSNYIDWRASWEADYPFTGQTIYGLTVGDWADDFHTIATQDQLFALWGTLEADNVVEADSEVIRLSATGNFTGSFFVTIFPVGFTDNVSCYVSLNPDMSSPISTYEILADNDSGIYVFSTSEILQDNPPIGQLLPDTLYFWQAQADDGSTYYSEIKNFITSPPIQFDKPYVNMSYIKDVSGYYSDKDYVFEVGAIIHTDNETDTVTGQGIQFSLNAQSNILLETIYSYAVYNVSSSGSYSITLDLSNLSSYIGQEIFFRAYIDTLNYGRLYSKLLSINPSFDKPPGSGGASSELTTTISDMFNKIKGSLGLTGIMGGWAFMGLILLIISLLFGTLALIQKESVARNAIVIVWALMSMAVVGGFLFTGELGVWPVIILVGIFVFGGLSIFGAKLSGNQGG